MFGLNFITFVPMLYCTTFLGANQDSYGTKLLFSGVVNGFATMLLIWIYIYTISHVDDEKVLATALENSINEPIVEHVDTFPVSESALESEF